MHHSQKNASRGIAISFCLALVFQAACAQSEQIPTKRILITSSSPSNEERLLLRSVSSSELEGEARKLGYELISSDRWCFLVSKKALPNQDAMAMKLSLMKSVLSGEAIDGYCLDLNKLDPKLASSLYNTMCNSTPALSQLGSPSKLKLMVEPQIRLNIASGSKTTSVDLGDIKKKRADLKKSEMVVDMSFDRTAYKQKPDDFISRRMEEQSLMFVYGGNLNETDQLDATAEASAWLRETFLKASKALSDANQYLMSQLAERAGLSNVDSSGNYSNLPDGVKAEIRAKVAGMASTLGLNSPDEINQFLQSAQYACAKPSLYLTIAIKDSKTGQSSVRGYQLSLSNTR